MDLFLKLISVLYILEKPISADASFCTFKIDGETKYYVCPRNEYCCNYGCCLSPTFQFYQLWYYWLMVIFMFLLCSGGQWWYRYWLQGQYRPDLSLTTSGIHGHCGGTASRGTASTSNTTQGVSPASGGAHASRTTYPVSERMCRSTRVTYHPARDALLLQPIWKPTYPPGSRGSPPPSYSQAQGVSVGASSSSSSCDSSLSDVQPGVIKPSLNQIYGPPPSYDSVVSEASGAGCAPGSPGPSLGLQSPSVSASAPEPEPAQGSSSTSSSDPSTSSPSTSSPPSEQHG